MKYRKFKHPFIAAIGSLLVGLISITGCAGNTENGFTIPTFTEPGPPPIEVTINQIYAEYIADEATADANYKGERLLFYEVEVEQVVDKYLQMAEALGAANPDLIKLYFTAGFVKFRLRGEDFSIMQNIEEGYVLNIVGECRGLQKEFIAIEDCWVESVIGDLGTGEVVDYY